MYARIFRAGLCWDGREKGGAWHLKTLLTVRCDDPLWMSGAVTLKEIFNQTIYLQTF